LNLSWEKYGMRKRCDYKAKAGVVINEIPTNNQQSSRA
jgi:hypothetical protein